MSYPVPLSQIRTLVRQLVVAFGISLILPLSAETHGTFGNFDDCGILLYDQAGGCLLFYPDNHSGAYFLQYTGNFQSGDRVHVSGDYNPFFFCGCESRCIQSNSISEGCSTPCSADMNDVTNDGRVNIGDVTTLIRYIFGATSEITCPDQADCNGNGRLEIGDVACIIDIVFLPQ